VTPSKAEKGWTKSQQNDWLLGLQVGTLYMKIDIPISTQWRSLCIAKGMTRIIRMISGAL